MGTLKDYPNLKPRPGSWGQGFGSGRHKVCDGTRTNGEPCRAPAMHGTSRCVKHGARRRAGMPAHRPHIRLAQKAVREWGPIPKELAQTEAWQAAEADTRQSRKWPRMAELRIAWDAAQQGDWTQWRAITIKT